MTQHDLLGGGDHFAERLPLFALPHLVLVLVEQHEAQCRHLLVLAVKLRLVDPKCRNL